MKASLLVFVKVSYSPGIDSKHCFLCGVTGCVHEASIPAQGSIN